MRIQQIRAEYKAFIEIKHVGPLIDTGKIELKMVNLLIGKQETLVSDIMVDDLKNNTNS